MAETHEGEHFVYLYRDERGRPLYVGRGRELARSMSHVGPAAHNDRLTAKIAKTNYSIAISGPFGDEAVAASVEAALISALNGTPGIELANKIEGVSTGVFRPMGVPMGFSSRVLELPVPLADLKERSRRLPIMLVLVNDKTLDDREGVNLAAPPSNEAIEARMVKWWQVNRFMDDWRNDPRRIPAVLLAISGKPAHQIIIGSLQVDRNVERLPWASGKIGTSEVPVIPNDDLDYLQLRGRRMAQGVANFGGIRGMHFQIV